jgi:hypothetical protein
MKSRSARPVRWEAMLACLLWVLPLGSAGLSTSRCSSSTPSFGCCCCQFRIVGIADGVLATLRAILFLSARLLGAGHGKGALGGR